MKFSCLLTLPLLLTIFSCQNQNKVKTAASDESISAVVKSTYPTDKPQKDIFRFKEGENKFLPEQQMNVTFLKTTDDSRCPMNARCVWAGNATVEIELMSTTSRPMKYQLSVGDLRNNLKNSVNFSGYKISLENLYPSNSTEDNFEKLKGKYVIDLKIEKSTN